MSGLEIKERQFDYGPQRSSWTFPVPIQTLIDGVRKQLDYHTRRHRTWRTRYAAAAGKEKRSLKAKQVQVTGGFQTIYEMDQGATQAKQLAETKMNQHRAEADRYREWLALFEYKGDAQSKWCTVEDATFFGLSGHTPDEK